MRVAVIGAGSSGLAAAKRLLQNRCEVVVFEQKGNVGGVWFPMNEQPRPLCSGQEFAAGVMHPSNIDHGSPLYPSLVTNLPCELMAYRDLEFRDAVPSAPQSTSFVSAELVQAYLESYALKFKLNNVIKFGRTVTSLAPVAHDPSESTTSEMAQDTNPKWQLESIDSGGAETATSADKFDAVIVCNGHYNTRFVPPKLLSDSAAWNGMVLHAKDYRNPSEFKGKVVVVVGAKSSGTDISRELCHFASKVVMCDTDCPVSDDDDRVTQFQLEKLGEGQWGFTNDLIKNKLEWRQALTGLLPGTNSLSFRSGNILKHADVVIFATGYRYTFPFLDNSIVSSSDGMVRPLYEQLVHTKYHNLHFLGLPYSVVPFPLAEIQALFSTNLLLGKAKLPSMDIVLREEIEISTRLDRGEHIVHWHQMGATQWSYCRRLLELANEMDEHWDELLQSREAVYSTLSSIRSSEHPGSFDAFRSLKIAEIVNRASLHQDISR